MCDFDDGAVVNAGSVTLANGSSGVTGAITVANSVVGSSADDSIGDGAVANGPLGTFAITGRNVDGIDFDTGAVTLIGSDVPLGHLSPTNSLFGETQAQLLSIPLGNRLTASGHLVVARPADHVVTLVKTGDNVAPVFTSTPPDVSADTQQGDDHAVVTYATPIATDDRGTPTVTCDPPSGSSFAVGTTIVLCTATDNTGNEATTTFAVNVTGVPDTTAPVFTPAPPDVDVDTQPGDDDAVVSYATPTATDNHDTPTVTCDPPSGSTFTIGTTTVTCTASDDSGNETTATFAVTVTKVLGPDTEPPVFSTPPPPVHVDVQPGIDHVVVSYPTPAATDDRGEATVTCVPPSGATFALGITHVICTATDAAGNEATATFDVIVASIAPTGSTDYTPLTPARLADTRPGFNTVDGQFAGIGERARTTTLELVVAGRGGVAANAKAVALNVTAVDSSGSGFVTIFPCGGTRPLASSVNFVPGATVPNAVIAKIGADGKVCIYVSEPTHIVVDVNGFFPVTTSYLPLNPARLLDTRPGETTVDGLQQAGGKNAGGTVTVLQVGGRGGVPQQATSVVLNLTVTEQEAPGYITVYPCDVQRPNASNLNAGPGVTRANMVISKIAADGTVCIYTQATTHLVADANGYFPVNTSFRGVEPARLLETRPDQHTVDGLFNDLGYVPAGSLTVVHVTGRAGVPTNATTVILNVTVDAPAGPGFITVFPCGVDLPLASNVNYVAGSTVPNSVIAKVGTNGNVCLFNSQPTHVIVDVTGFFAG